MSRKSSPVKGKRSMNSSKVSINVDQIQKPDFTQLEKLIEEYWVENQTFQLSVNNRPVDKQYVFYDGPPFATGMPHYGHLLGSTSKDVIARYWTMKGYRVERVWGWDCHGLPIENMIEGVMGITRGKKEIEERGIDVFNNTCRAEVLRLDKEWEKIINRLGRWVDFQQSYKTMDTNFMESVWWGFSELYKKGLVYKDKKVILYCPRCATPLSNFEIAMDNSYQMVKETATTYKYPIDSKNNTFILAWSTTPWNKLVTPALAINPNLEYVEVKQGNEHYILAKSTLKSLNDQPYEIVRSWSSQELTQLTFKPHFDYFPNRKETELFGVIVADEFVTADEGTGVVTLAIYGEDDFRVMKREGIQMPEHVNDEGKLIDSIRPWGGLSILEANPLINAELSKRNLIYSDLPYTHSVPLCYRCNTRLYHAPLPAWFINIQVLKPQLLAANQKMNWYPNHLKNGRFAKGIESAPDWNISRSRYWGTPIPIWESKTGQIRVISSIAELKKWAVNPAQIENIADIHRENLDHVEVWVDDNKTIPGMRIPEVFDCWVESGSMPFASRHYPFENKELFDHTYPAQFVSEYIAQTRAWFYTVHVLSVAIFNQHAVENTLTTGTIMAHDGNKMSKSKKNFPDPVAMMDKYGVDSLRLYLMSSPVMKGENINFNEQEISDIRKRILMIWWNVFSFYRLYDNQTTATDYLYFDFTKVENVLDQWILSRIKNLAEQTTTLLDNYDVVRSSRAIMSFISDLSNWYIRTSRDRFRNPETQKEPIIVLCRVLTIFSQLIAPFAPFLSDLIYQSLPNTSASVHLNDWPNTSDLTSNLQLENEMTLVRSIAEKSHSLRKVANLKLRQPLSRANVESGQPKPSQESINVLASEINVKQIDWQQSKEVDLNVSLETNLTAELIAEGEAREIIRSIQQLRKSHGLAPQTIVNVKLPDWPKEWQTTIEQKTDSVLSKGDKLELNVTTT